MFVSQMTVIGTADTAVDPALVEEVNTVEDTEALVAEGADDGLDIAGEVVAPCGPHPRSHSDSRLG